MRFQALHCGKQLRIINPHGDVGVVTLWSTVRSVWRVFEQQSIELDCSRSRIAVIANLYGNGLTQMLRNLLWNPQIRYLLVLGQDLSESKAALCRFFSHGLEPVDFLGAPMYRIVGTRHITDGDITPQHFKHGVDICALGQLSKSETKMGLMDFFDTLPTASSKELQRIEIPITDIPLQHFPSETNLHAFSCHSPLDAWEELIFRLDRFGIRNRVSKRGVNSEYYEQERIELQNVHINILNPKEDREEHLKEHQFSLDHLRTLQRKILNPSLPPDQTYNYGNRLGGYFRNNGEVVDALAVVAKKLLEQPESRHCYVSLWDSGRDLLADTGHPCMVSLFFRRFDNKLSLSATFRTHNAFDAWLPNAYCLIAIQKFVAEKASMECGVLTLISHSISLDTSVLVKSRAIAARKLTSMVVNRDNGKRTLRFDPNGSIKITLDFETRELVVEHLYNEVRINQYRAKSALEMEHLLSRDCVVSDISHAFYVGRELTKAELLLRKSQ